MDGPRRYEKQIPYDFTYTWELMNEIEEQTKLRETPKHRDWMGGWGLGERGGGTEAETGSHRTVTRCQAQHREHSRKYCDNYMWCPVGAGNTGVNTVQRT